MLALTNKRVTFGAFPAFLASRVAPPSDKRFAGGSATRRTGGTEPVSTCRSDSTHSSSACEWRVCLSRTYYVLRHTDPGFDVGDPLFSQ